MISVSQEDSYLGTFFVWKIGANAMDQKLVDIMKHDFMNCNHFTSITSKNLSWAKNIYKRQQNFFKILKIFLYKLC
jgi:hypothetical protein